MWIGIMQGRLVPPGAGRIQSFPRDRWRDEFAAAAVAGLNGIEWIYDAFGADVNPLTTDTGLDEMRALAQQHGVCVHSICADYFMEFPLLRAEPVELRRRTTVLTWLLQRGQRLGMNRLVLPFVDSSRIESDADRETVVSLLRQVSPAAEATNMEIHLETSLPPERFAGLLADVPHPLIKVNYDSGNSASLGYKPRDEFAVYGSRVGSVHIKDRIRGGGTVPLGTGDTDFTALAASLAASRYAGEFVLQVARGVAGDEVHWAQQNCAFVHTYFGP